MPLIPALLDTPGPVWKMFSYDHWSRRAIAGNTEQMTQAGNSEARGDGGAPRTRG